MVRFSLEKNVMLTKQKARNLIASSGRWTIYRHDAIYPEFALGQK